MNCLESGSGEPAYSTAARLGLDITLSISIFTINLFIMFAVLRYERHVERPSPHSSRAPALLILNLSAADIVVGVGFVYLILPRYVCAVSSFLKYRPVLCALRAVLINTGHFASGFTLMSIVLDRYIAVLYTFQYGNIMNTRRTWVIIGVIWLLSTILSTMPFYWNTWEIGQNCSVILIQPRLYDIILTLFTCVVTITLAVLYWRIHRVAITVCNGTEHRKMSAVQRMNTRSALTLLLILVVYTISWTPYLVILYMLHTGYALPPFIYQLASSEVKLNYLANPFIYAFNTRPVKLCMLRAFKEFKKTLSAQNSSFSVSGTSPLRPEPEGRNGSECATITMQT